MRWESVAAEDAYEQYYSNDTQQNAYWISGYEETWLSSIDGEGIANDHDYYAIEVSSGEERLLVDLQFTDADGDIDVVVYDADGNSVDASTSVTDNEFIDVNLSNPGTYYLDVYNYSGSGNTYDLLWLDHDPYGTSGADTIEGLRTLPIAALYDGNQFLVEKYSLSMIPAFNLIDSNYTPKSLLTLGETDFYHPFYWSGFTLISSPW